jgi:cell volume regulation protein A
MDKLRLSNWGFFNDTKALGKAIHELNLPPETLVMSIKRGDHTFIPDGNTVLAPGDHLIILVRDKHIEKVEDIFTNESGN